MAERKLINNRENGMLNTCYIKNVSIMTMLTPFPVFSQLAL